MPTRRSNPFAEAADAMSNNLYDLLMRIVNETNCNFTVNRDTVVWVAFEASAACKMGCSWRGHDGGVQAP
jgi:hypothetical protein